MKTKPASTPDSWWLRTRRLLLPSCREMTRLTSQAMDRPPGAVQRLGMGLHLAMCAVCRRYRRQLNWIRKVAGAMPDDPSNLVPVRLQREARERLKERLRAALKASEAQEGSK